MERITVNVNDVQDYDFQNGTYYIIEGKAERNVKLRTKLPWSESALLDFNRVNMGPYNIQLQGCERLIIHRAHVSSEIDHGLILNKAFQNIISESSFYGTNGVWITNGSGSNFFYRCTGVSYQNDGFTCHKNKDGECGDHNFFYKCYGYGKEEAFDLVSGVGHFLYECDAGSASSWSVAVNNKSSGVIFNCKSDKGLMIKECSFLQIYDSMFSKIAFRTSKGRKPQNVRLYSSGFYEYDIRNIEDLDLDKILNITGTIYYNSSYIKDSAGYKISIIKDYDHDISLKE